MNSFVSLIVVPAQMHLSYPLSVSSKTDWADTMPHSLRSKLLRALCLRPTQQRSELQKQLWSWGPNCWHQKLSVGCKMTEMVFHLPIAKLPTSPPSQENVFLLEHICQITLPGAFEAMHGEQNRGNGRITTALCVKLTADWSLGPNCEPRAPRPLITMSSQPKANCRTGAWAWESSHLLECTRAPSVAQIASVESCAALPLIGVRPDSHLQHYLCFCKWTCSNSAHSMQLP